jgi:hypothetical protein
VSDGWLHDVGRAVHRSRCCSFWAVCDLDTTWKFGNEASHRLVDLRWLLWTVVAQCIRLGFKQNWTVGNLAKVVRGEAIHCCVRESLLVPAVLEISVETVSSRIALREDEQAIRTLIRHQSDIIKDFQENVRNLYGMSGWADSIVDRTLVSDVRVVCFVVISSVPAALEMDLGTHAIRTICVVHVIFLDNLWSQTVESDSISDRPTWVFLRTVCHCRIIVAPR